jgi:hypothetical protein
MKLHHVHFLFTERQRLIGFDLLHDDELSDFDKRFRIILHKHLTIFASWSILNCVVGLIALFILKGSAYYFWMMSGIWGVINFAFAIAFFYHTLYRKLPKISFYERLVVQSHVEQMMFLNSRIDVAYVFVGFWLREHSFICDVSYPDLWLGFGWAIIMQGLYLLVQDMMFLRLHHRNFRKAHPFLETLLKVR